MTDLHSAGHGAIMYDVWTMHGIHNVGLFACYLQKESQVVDGSGVVVKFLRLVWILIILE